MDFNEIPDDVWFVIFESVENPAELAVLVRTCRRFHDLASKPLLRELRWGKAKSTKRNLEAWKGVYKDVVTLPRKLTVGVTFDFSAAARIQWHVFTPEMELYDSIHLQMPLFTSLNEIEFDGTLITPFMYSILAKMPNLRTLSISNCTYYSLDTSFRKRQENRMALIETHPEPFPFDSLPITHLSLHKANLPPEYDYRLFHPFYLATAPNLTFLSITWTSGLAVAYAPKKWLLPKLTQLDVVIPLLTRDTIDSLVNFVQNCPMGPRIQLSIERHNLSEQQIAALQLPLIGVWSYKGPLTFASFSAPRQRDREPSLTHLVMNDPLDLAGLLDGIEKLPKSVEHMEIQVRRWDVELLFAIRSLFPNIRSLVIRYGYGTFPADFFVTLGANILFDLPKLHTIKILLDKSCVVTNRQLANANQNYWAGHGQPIHHAYHSFEHNHEAEPEIAPSSPTAATLEHADLKDYLIGWNRYCKSLRHVQLDSNSWWERKYEGDRWVEKPNRYENVVLDRELPFFL